MNNITLNNGEIIQIREALKEDATGLLAFLDRIGGESDNLTFGHGEMKVTLEQEEAFIEGMREKPNSIFLCALNNTGRIIGTTHFMAGTMPRTRHAGELGVTVVKDYWGMGLGSILMDRLIEWIREQKTIRKVNLRVRADNDPAIHIYEKKGFVREGLITREYLIGGTLHDVLWMGLQLDEEEESSERMPHKENKPL